MGNNKQTWVEDLAELADGIKSSMDERMYFLEQLRTNTADILRSSRKSQTTMSKELRKNLSSEVNSIFRDTADLMEEFRNTRMSMVDNQRKWLRSVEKERLKSATEFRNYLRVCVSEIKNNVASIRKENLDENTSAHNIWMDLSKDMAIKRMKKTSKKEGAPPTKPSISDEKVNKKLKEKKPVKTTKQEHKPEIARKKTVTHKPKAKKTIKKTRK